MEGYCFLWSERTEDGEIMVQVLLGKGDGLGRNVDSVDMGLQMGSAGEGGVELEGNAACSGADV